MPEWIRDELGWLLDLLEKYGLLVVVASIVVFIVGLLAVRMFLIRIPEDSFVNERRSSRTPPGRHPALHFALMVVKNLVGGAFIISGLVLSLPGIPGPGIITLLIGLSLTDIPGKRRFERKIIQNRLILNTINGIRMRAGKSPLLIGDEEKSSQTVQ